MSNTMPVDASSPDAAILAAYEAIRASKARIYTVPDLPDDEAQEAEDERCECIIDSSVATTIPGIVARLLEAIPHINQDRWIDQDLTLNGPLSLYRERDDLPANVRPLVQAAYEMLHIEWRRVLAVYEPSKGAASLADLVRAIPPDEDAYRRKLEIVEADGGGSDTEVWLARDAAFLSGNLQRAVEVLA